MCLDLDCTAGPVGQAGPKLRILPIHKAAGAGAPCGKVKVSKLSL